MNREKAYIDEILLWATTFAQGDDSTSIHPHHFLLGAMKSDTGLNLLGRIAGSRSPFSQDLLPLPIQQKVLMVMTPTALPNELQPSESLNNIFKSLHHAGGTITTEGVLRHTLYSLRDTKDWGHIADMIFSAGRRETGKELPLLFNDCSSRTDELETFLRNRIIGQDQAITLIRDAFSQIFLIERNRHRDSEHTHRGPAIIFTFAGPPGIGKTYTAECLAEFFQLGDEDKGLLRLDMSGYASRQNFEALIGVASFYAKAKGGLLTNFAANHPTGFLLVDELEKAHSTTQNLFLQILDTGRLYDTYLQKDIDFSGLTIIFTTNLGKVLYDAPNRTGVFQASRVLSSALVDAMSRELTVSGERSTTDSSRGLPPELLSRLAKGHAVLFNRLSGLALERLVAQIIRDIAGKVKRSTGLNVDYSEPLILTLLALRFGAARDARQLTASISHFLLQAVQNSIKTYVEAVNGETAIPNTFHEIYLTLQNNAEIPPQLQALLTKKTQICVISARENLSFLPEDAYLCYPVLDTPQADQILRAEPIDLVLLDLSFDNADKDKTEYALERLRWFRTKYPNIPVYLLHEEPAGIGVAEQTLNSIAQEGGARGVVQPPLPGEPGNQDTFLKQLLDISLELRRESIIHTYQRHGKVIEFDLRKVNKGDRLELTFCQLREVRNVSALDWNGPGMVDLPNDRFEDILGAENAVQRLKEVVGWLSDPRPVLQMGLTIPKGILLTGPPGTGKTTLARAVAGEADVPFFAISGSDLFSVAEKHPATVIRDLFECAHRYSPAIIFIDEIDTIGKFRQAASSELSTRIINELLVQMDGFRQGDRPVFVIAASNRPDVLDKALVRSGRLDLTVEVPLPHRKARMAIFEMYMNKVNTSPEIQLDEAASRSAGFSGADIRQVFKEAGMIALRQGQKSINQRMLNEAITNLRFGLAEEVREMSNVFKYNTAVHEAGHAVVSHLLLPDRHIHQVTILPRGRAAGFIESAAGEDYHDMTPSSLKAFVQMLLGGRAAEEMLLGIDNISSGSRNDLYRATVLALRMAGEYGMVQDIGILSISGIEEVFGNIAQNRLSFHDMIVAGARQWLHEQFAEVHKLLEKKEKTVKLLADLLLEKETLYGDEITLFFDNSLTKRFAKD